MNFGNRKKSVWLVLLFFLSTGGGVAVFFIWKSLPSLANPPDLRLYSSIRNAKTAFELAKESMPEERAAKKPDPFKQPEAYFKDDSKSASGGPGSGTAGRYSQGPSGGAPSSRMGTKLASRFRKPAMKGRLKRGIRSSRGSSASGRSVSSFKKTAALKATVSRTLSSAEKDSPLRGALASLKRTSEHIGAGAFSTSGDTAKYHADLAYGEAQAGRTELSHGKNLARLDTMKTEVKDLKMQASRTLTAPDPGAPTRDEAAEAKDPVLQKIKDTAEKAANPMEGLVNSMFSPMMSGLGGPGGGGPEGAPPPGGYPGGDSPGNGSPKTNAPPPDGPLWDAGDLLNNNTHDELWLDYYEVQYMYDDYGNSIVIGVYDDIRNEYAAVNYDPSSGRWVTASIYNLDAGEYTYTQPEES